MAGDSARPGAGLVAFGASCASQPAHRRIDGPDRQRVSVKYTRDTGQRSEVAESLLDALEGSLRLFEKHRVLILGQLQRQPSE